MLYSISSISTRDVQLLHHYRILRYPAGTLSAIYTQAEPITLGFSLSYVSSRTYEGQPLYAATSAVKNPENKIPMIEFRADDADGWSCIESLVEVDVRPEGFVFYATRDVGWGSVEFDVYWVDSLKTVETTLSRYEEELKKLGADLETVQSNANLNVDEFVSRPDGIQENLVVFKKTASGVVLGDSLHKITGAIVKQGFMEPTQEFLSSMVRDVTEDISITKTQADTVLQDFYGGGQITIIGNGTWYLTNIKNDIVFYKFTGTVYAKNCPSIVVGNDCNFANVYLINSCWVHNSSIIRNVQLSRRSVLKHNSGKIENIQHIGVGCEYYSRVNASDEPTISWSRCEGLYCSSTGLTLLNGIEISFKPGHHDDPLPPSEVDVTVKGDVPSASRNGD